MHETNPQAIISLKFPRFNVRNGAKHPGKSLILKVFSVNPVTNLL